MTHHVRNTIVSFAVLALFVACVTAVVPLLSGTASDAQATSLSETLAGDYLSVDDPGTNYLRVEPSSDPVELLNDWTYTRKSGYSRRH